MHRLTLAIAVVALSACATKEQSRLEDISVTPLRDLNIAKVEIPAILSEAMEHPYSLPADRSCAGLQSQLASLDEELGPDIDIPEEKLNRIDASRAALSNAATGALQNTVEGAIPFRGWLRKLSGAERHSRQVQSAILAGKIRRGYLKGVLATSHCQKA
jgi:hypothetical protein